MRKTVARALKVHIDTCTDRDIFQALEVVIEDLGSKLAKEDEKGGDQIHVNTGDSRS
jgi:hypothetical protein